MIGKTEWFKRRKYTGWGVGTPKTWQGWVYIAVILIPFIVFQLLPFWDNTMRLAITVIWVVIIGIDVTDMMIRSKNDEREKMHEAIAERNAAWFMVIVLSIGLAYQMISNALQQKLYVNPFIVIALIGGVFIKMISNIYLDRKN